MKHMKTEFPNNTLTGVTFVKDSPFDRLFYKAKIELEYVKKSYESYCAIREKYGVYDDYIIDDDMFSINSWELFHSLFIYEFAEFVTKPDDSIPKLGLCLILLHETRLLDWVDINIPKWSRKILLGAYFGEQLFLKELVPPLRRFAKLYQSALEHKDSLGIGTIPYEWIAADFRHIMLKHLGFEQFDKCKEITKQLATGLVTSSEKKFWKDLGYTDDMTHEAIKHLMSIL